MMCNKFTSPLTFFFIFLNAVTQINASNYDAYMAQLAAESQSVRDEFLRQNPRGQIVLDRLSSPDYREHSDGEQFDEERWRDFLEDLDAARHEAALDAEEESKRAPDSYNVRDSDVDTQEVYSRKPEEAFQNYLWGTHKVSGGSSEVGKWLDYALVGAGAQDDDEEGNDLAIEHDKHEVIKNDNLPSYCDPPNPCPVGYDPATMLAPCDSSTVYTLEANRAWILSKMANGECSCDSEHMNTCQLNSTASPMDTISWEKMEKMPQKNYFLRGQVLKEVVKKDGRHTFTTNQ